MTDMVEWIATDRKRVAEAEDSSPGVRDSYPATVAGLSGQDADAGLDIPVLRRSGKVERLTGEGWIWRSIPSLSEELYKWRGGCASLRRSAASLEPQRLLDALERSR